MKTLEEMLRERAGGDQRASVAAIDVQRSRVRILLGAIGNLGRIILSVEGDEVKVVYPVPEEAEDAAEAGDDGETGERRSVDINAGEFVDDRDPLHPGENPLDAVARIEAEGLNARQAEAVSTTTAIAGAVPPEAGEAGGEGLSEIKNPQGASNGDAGNDDGEKSGDDAGGELEKDAGGEDGDGQNANLKDEPESNLKDAPKAETIDPTSMTKDQLLAVAEKEGVAVNGGATKAEIASAINAKRGEAAKQ